MARRCWPASTNFPPTGPRLRWLFCICCFCLAHALETMSKDKSGAAKSLMSSSPALTTSTDTRRSPSILRRRSWRRYLSVSLCSRGFGEHKTTPICTTGSRALAVEERAFNSTPRKSNCSPTLIRHSHICSKFETRVRSGLAISCSESEEPPQSQDFVQRDTRVAKLRHPASVEDVNYQSPRGLDRALFLKLAACDWIAERRNLLITGASGPGQELARLRPRPQGVPREHVRSLHSHAPALRRSRHRPRRRALRPAPALSGARQAAHPPSQVPIDRWHDLIGVPTLADAILDRVIQNAHRIELAGESLRMPRSLP